VGPDEIEDAAADFARSVQIVSPLPDFLGPEFSYLNSHQEDAEPAATRPQPVRLRHRPSRRPPFDHEHGREDEECRKSDEYHGLDRLEGPEAVGRLVEGSKSGREHRADSMMSRQRSRRRAALAGGC